jgi:NRAMP (natural resistance-associated macrophage protein)-like metal ion transporter
MISLISPVGDSRLVNGNVEKQADTEGANETKPAGSPGVESAPADAAPRQAAGRGRFKRIGRFIGVLGPGLITGASDDDPSGIATYAMAGASLGFATLWTAILTLPFMAAIQFTCAKIGLVSGTGLASVLRQHYSRRPLYIVLVGLVIANTINAGADIGAIAAAINLLVPVPIRFLIVPIALLLLVMQIWCSYRLIAQTFKWLSLSLLAYVGAAILARPHWGEVLKATFIPSFRFDHTYLLMLVAIFGTTISPYLFFWQASQEVEEEISQGRKQIWERRGATDAELKDAALDINAGMLFCNLIFYFVVLATAATLHAQGKTDIASAAEAAQALRPFAGNAATVLFALGLIGSGIVAVPVLTGSAAYAVAEAMGWEYGLDEKLGRAKHFYAAIALSTLAGMLINFVGINPITALFWTAVINGLLAPPLLAVIMLIANNREVMGDRVNHRLTNVLGWATTLIMFAAAICLILTWGESV